MPQDRRQDRTVNDAIQARLLLLAELDKAREMVSVSDSLILASGHLDVDIESLTRSRAGLVRVIRLLRDAPDYSDATQLIQERLARRFSSM